MAEQNPWLPAAVFNAYSQAKQLNYGYIAKIDFKKRPLDPTMDPDVRHQ